MRSLGQNFPRHVLILTVTTGGGLALARQQAVSLVDAVLPAPLDIVPVVRRFVRCIAPRLFILVETDFWPGWLMSLDLRQIPRILVNGRMSAQSIRRCGQLRFVAVPLLAGFARLCMQSESDAHALQSLGLEHAVPLG